jgi:hypothetical protein
MPIDDDPNSKSIDLFDESEVAEWCRNLGTNVDDLAAAVNAVGVKVADVQKYLWRIQRRRC